VRHVDRGTISRRAVAHPPDGRPIEAGRPARPTE
jgi:hypothetical protein